MSTATMPSRLERILWFFVFFYWLLFLGIEFFSVKCAIIQGNTHAFQLFVNTY